MTLEGIKKAMARIDEVECFVLTSTFKIYPGRMKPDSLKFDEDAQTLEYQELDGMVDYLIDINDIDVVVFNKGNKLNPNFPV